MQVVLGSRLVVGTLDSHLPLTKGLSGFGIGYEDFRGRKFEPHPVLVHVQQSHKSSHHNMYPDSPYIQPLQVYMDASIPAKLTLYDTLSCPRLSGDPLMGLD